MSTSPSAGQVSRRSLLRGAASVGVLAVLAAGTGCAADDAGSAGGSTAGGTAPADTDTGSDLLRLGHLLAEGPDGPALAAARPAGSPSAATDAEVVAAVTALGTTTRTDAATGRTVVGDGWLLGTSEAAVLVAYASACPMPSC